MFSKKYDAESGTFSKATKLMKLYGWWAYAFVGQILIHHRPDQLRVWYRSFSRLVQRTARISRAIREISSPFNERNFQKKIFTHNHFSQQFLVFSSDICRTEILFEYSDGKFRWKSRWYWENRTHSVIKIWTQNCHPNSFCEGAANCMRRLLFWHLYFGRVWALSLNQSGEQKTRHGDTKRRFCTKVSCLTSQVR